MVEDFEKHPAVYIVAIKRNGTLYIGVTSNIWMCIAAHKNGEIRGFTEKYGVKMLVWYEHHHRMENAIKREKQLKKWNRAWKLELIEKFNPNWRDLHDEIDISATLVGSSNAESLGPHFRGNDGVMWVGGRGLK